MGPIASSRTPWQLPYFLHSRGTWRRRRRRLQVVYQPPPAPTAPPLPFAFMGSYRTQGGGAVYYLTAGDRVYDVKVGDTLDNTYSVDGVKSGQLLLTYMPLKIQQSIAVGDE